MNLSSANSINIGRLIPQVAYYFYTYLRLVENGRIGMGQKINFSVPTGNFGDILAGYIAKKMGLPVNKLICASNMNKILTDFFKTGVYDKRRKFYITQSPSMDILISSNFERLLWFVTRDDEYVSSLMRDLKNDGLFMAKELLPFLKDFAADYATEQETAEEIGRVFKEHGYLIDTHTAVASAVARKMDLPEYTVILSTASPYKFCSSVLEALGETPSEDEFESLDRLAAISGMPAPYTLTSLRDITRVHDNCGGVKEVKAMIKDFLEKGDA